MPFPYDRPKFSGRQSDDINANAVPRMARHLREFASIRKNDATCKFFFSLLKDLDDHGLLEDSGHLPRLGLGHGTRFRDFNLVTDATLIGFVVSVILLALDDVLAVEGVLDATLDQNGHGLVHLVARNHTGEGAGELCSFSIRHFAAAF